MPESSKIHHLHRKLKNVLTWPRPASRRDSAVLIICTTVWWALLCVDVVR